MKAICVSGSVGCGKTTFSKKFAKEKGFVYLDLSSFIKENKLRDKYDRKMKTYDVDIKKLNKKLIEKIKESKKKLVIDGHLSHYLSKKYVEKVFIIKCELSKLKKRLEKRKYSKLKVRENLDAEIFDVCYEEAKELGHKVIVKN